MNAEDNISICQEGRAENAIEIAVDAALRMPEINEETYQVEEYSSEEEQQAECIPKASVKEFQLAAEAFQKQVKTLVAQNHGMCDSFGCDLPGILVVQIENAKACRKTRARQSRINVFFGM